jgi:hypothetical protein
VLADVAPDTSDAVSSAAVLVAVAVIVVPVVIGLVAVRRRGRGDRR